MALQLPADSGQPFGSVPIPSLHRPELINYWVNQLVYRWLVNNNVPAADAWRMVLRPDQFAPVDVRKVVIATMARAMMRPLAVLHPGIGLANPEWANWGSADLANRSEQDLINHWQASPVLNGPWDVDNDGDGLRDSVWVDLGFPVRQTPDGRYYKPLFAIHCVDLDGRLNLNSHGQWAQLEPEYYQPADPTVQTFLANPSEQRILPLVDPSGQTDLQGYYRYAGRGLGVGPAEISLLPLVELPDGSYQIDVAKRLLGGVKIGGEALEGRYGEQNLVLAGTTPQPGATGVHDFRSFNKLINFPSYFASWQECNPNPHKFGTPFDLRGYLAVALDIVGQPVWHSYPGVSAVG